MKCVPSNLSAPELVKRELKGHGPPRSFWRRIKGLWRERGTQWSDLRLIKTSRLQGDIDKSSYLQWPGNHYQFRELEAGRFPPLPRNSCRGGGKRAAETPFYSFLLHACHTNIRSLKYYGVHQFFPEALLSSFLLASEAPRNHSSVVTVVPPPHTLCRFCLFFFCRENPCHPVCVRIVCCKARKVAACKASV